MGTMNDIKLRLESGSTASQLIGEGYAKSSVNQMARKLKKTASVRTPTPLVDDEIQELRQQREKIKLQKEIAELEAAKENMPERVATLEKAIPELRSLMADAVDTALFQSLVYAGMDENEAREYADGWVDKNIKG